MNWIKQFAFEKLIPFVGRILVCKNRYVNVIYYHDIVSSAGETYMRTNINIFRCQMQYLSENGYETLTFDDLNKPDKVTFKRKRIVIAFDDGWRSNYSEIFDYMKSLGIKYNIFLTIGEISKNPGYLTWDLVRRMHASGFVGFGVHTYTHPHVADMTGIDLQKEFVNANEVFQNELGYEPLDFCYPYGSYSEKAHEYLTTQTNYQRIYTSSMMYSYQKNGRIVFGRNGINNSWPLSVFMNQVKGYYNAFNSLYKHK